MKDNNIVLIDSDDDTSTVKRQKVDTPEAQLPKFTRGFGTSQRLLQSDEEDDQTRGGSGSESGSESANSSGPSSGTGVVIGHDVIHPSTSGDRGLPAAIRDKFEAEDHYLLDSANASDDALSQPSHLAPIGSSFKPEEDEEEDEESDDYDSSDLDHVSLSDLDKIPPETIIETRKYLKQHGNMKFLEKYLPTAASAEDIIRLILKLGFVPRNLPDPDNANIMSLIKFLNYAMVKVKSIRTRLDDVKTIEDAISLIQNASKILVITGAGISTSLGIPDFRSSQGFYSQVQHLGLSDPQEVFDLELFLADPTLFYSIAHMILPPGKIFSPLHSFISVLQSKGKLLRNYTQNIDNLESYAGISTDKLIQCHGSFATATCVTCKYHVQGEEIFGEIKNQEIPYCPHCKKSREKLMDREDIFTPESYGVLKPDITFFGEPLPQTFHDSINKDLHECDLLISIGTSLKVAPVADIVDKIPENVPQILINKDPIDHCNFDVSLLGYCDDVASYLADKLGPGWEIPHGDFNKIRGTPEEPNLELSLIDEEYREYEIVNRTTEKSIGETAEELEHELKLETPEVDPVKPEPSKTSETPATTGTIDT